MRKSWISWYKECHRDIVKFFRWLNQFVHASVLYPVQKLDPGMLRYSVRVDSQGHTRTGEVIPTKRGSFINWFFLVSKNGLFNILGFWLFRRLLSQQVQPWSDVQVHEDPPQTKNPEETINLFQNLVLGCWFWATGIKLLQLMCLFSEPKTSLEHLKKAFIYWKIIVVSSSKFIFTKHSKTLNFTLKPAIKSVCGPYAECLS